MTNYKSVSTPLDRNVKLRQGSQVACDVTWFQQIVGSLIYLTITQPDISYLVRMITQYMQKPTKEHIQFMHRILRYISGTKDRGLLYQSGIVETLVGYMDAD